MSIWTRLGDLFAPRLTVTKSHTVREMTPAEQKAFDDAFAAMDTAFAEMDKAFKALRGDGA